MQDPANHTSEEAELLRDKREEINFLFIFLIFHPSVNVTRLKRELVPEPDIPP